MPKSNCLLICMTIKAAPDATHAADTGAGTLRDEQARFAMEVVRCDYCGEEHPRFFSCSRGACVGTPLATPTPCTRLSENGRVVPLSFTGIALRKCMTDGFYDLFDLGNWKTNNTFTCSSSSTVD